MEDKIILAIRKATVRICNNMFLIALVLVILRTFGVL